MKRGQTPAREAGPRAGRLISCHSHSLQALGLCAAAQDTRTSHCSRQKVLGRSLCHSPEHSLGVGQGT